MTSAMRRPSGACAVAGGVEALGAGVAATDAVGCVPSASAAPDDVNSRPNPIKNKRIFSPLPNLMIPCAENPDTGRRSLRQLEIKLFFRQAAIHKRLLLGIRGIQDRARQLAEEPAKLH